MLACLARHDLSRWMHRCDPHQQKVIQNADERDLALAPSPVPKLVLHASKRCHDLPWVHRTTRMLEHGCGAGHGVTG
jgi:hypothetical protein